VAQQFEIGDLVFLEDANIVGIVLDIQIFGTEDKDIDVEVQWIDGEKYWCLAEGLTIAAKAAAPPDV